MKIAVVGAGIAGLASAWLLVREHQVTLFEAGDYLGGHTHTVDVAVEGITHPVDTGFLVCNHRTYPNLTALFRLLGVDTVASDMSFAVSLDDPDLEWAGSSLATLFAQKRNLARPGFWRMLQDILRFNRETAAADLPDTTLGAYLAANRYSAELRDWYLLPMAAAIWSCPTQAMLDYPLATFVRFCRNHGLLQVFDRPQWLTVKGGGREYVNRLAAAIPDIRLATPVQGVVSYGEGVVVDLPDGSFERFDQVVLACHSDQALALLGHHASAEERAVLGAIRYQPNRAVLHTDAALLPRDRRVWSAWNYMTSGSESEPRGRRPVSVSYLINQLQPLPFATPVVVSLNPHREPQPETVIGDYDYAHPLFDVAAIAAQQRLHEIQGRRGLWFCGAWGGYGFHEDGLKSALAVANGLGVRAPWQDGANATERAA
ncbi:NAD(P)/FAD-dependent oxidoreductase [Sulfurisoma sediminicola]|uniref:Putative NAD/FAD-binding protein n=1 Tax=Sulfurisoma sediminicola TaxID=1381557 RepID=A0A497XE16_9PROT|nr:FAD-dependent oxidoreductase [Sulfurisoma sediminicola]RLJ64906.1 putative NAD/FAD-binding protein [Sulfurisoma sediminicola]